ncbi:hypothetical protein [Mycobacterium marinum]|uniref:hypothetical protein n=1 Tax=Mycobacterium marinum TaxID=1781 RepID=UPI00129341DD|nr:hypothetical protein [Mycobacterium marinum]
MSDFGAPHVLISLFPGLPSPPDTTDPPEVSVLAGLPTMTRLSTTMSQFSGRAPGR